MPLFHVHIGEADKYKRIFAYKNDPSINNCNFEAPMIAHECGVA